MFRILFFYSIPTEPWDVRRGDYGKSKKKLQVIICVFRGGAPEGNNLRKIKRFTGIEKKIYSHFIKILQTKRHFDFILTGGTL